MQVKGLMYVNNDFLTMTEELEQRLKTFLKVLWDNYQAARLLKQVSYDDQQTTVTFTFSHPQLGGRTATLSITLTEPNGETGSRLLVSSGYSYSNGPSVGFTPSTTDNLSVESPLEIFKQVTAAGDKWMEELKTSNQSHTFEKIDLADLKMTYTLAMFTGWNFQHVVDIPLPEYFRDSLMNMPRYITDEILNQIYSLEDQELKGRILYSSFITMTRNDSVYALYHPFGWFITAVVKSEDEVEVEVMSIDPDFLKVPENDLGLDKFLLK